MRKKIIKTALYALCIGLFLSTGALAQTQTNITGPAGSGAFGQGVYALPNGNIVVTDPGYDVPGGATDVGAVYLYNGSTRALISTLTGSTASDFVGNNIVVLTNGNFVIGSPNWHNGAAANAGAATFANGTSGVSGVVSAVNSLVGTTASSFVGGSTTRLTNGNYVVSSTNWSSGGLANLGAATFGNGTTGIVGAVSAGNSLVGSAAGSFVGFSVGALTNGNYVVGSPNWNNGTAANVGAATFGSGTSGVSGVVSAANSLVGSKANDSVGFSITPLTNGNYVISSSRWDNGAIVDAGAATFGSGTTGISGAVSPANSLVGTTASDLVAVNNGQTGFTGVAALANGNYVVRSPNWNNGAAVRVGAATFGSGTTGIVGAVSPANSLIGEFSEDSVSSKDIVPLANGNYVVGSQFKGIVGIGSNVGAATWGNGTTGTTGIVSASNSLIGSLSGDLISSSGITPLTNGNYVVGSINWRNLDPAAQNAGAATFGNGAAGTVGSVSSANSLVGTQVNDNVGLRVTALANGNYVVGSPSWDNGTITDAGAATFGSGTNGIVGAVSTSNSLFGTESSSFIGFNTTALKNGNYVVNSPNWKNGGAANVGAATFGSGTNGIVGAVSAANSLVGTQADDFVGGGGIFPLSNGNYVVRSPAFSNGTAIDVGAISYGSGSGGTVGPITTANSVIGTGNNGGNIAFSFDAANNQLVVGRPADNTVTLFHPAAPTAPQRTRFDFDGDGRSDLSVFRPSTATWYINRSTGGFAGVTFGAANDLITPGDFDGDGKTDIAVFRPSNGTWYYIKSSNNTFNGVQFGQSGDLPRPADFDGDDKADIAVFRPSNGFWYRLNSSNGAFVFDAFGQNGDVPVAGDYDGDGKANLAVFRPSNGFWYIAKAVGVPAQDFDVVRFGLGTDIPTALDFDGDDKIDVAVFRPSDGIWYRLNSTNGAFVTTRFGQNGDVPVAADYDGDGKADVAVFRSGIWYYQKSSNSEITGVNFGTATDKPIPGAFIP